ncbi:listeriolysin S family TOMM bacteriocin [Vagococcus lutrae]|nr:listeriolysin S family TOMM bacteriocin [Vagococcus lutrae]
MKLKQSTVNSYNSKIGNSEAMNYAAGCCSCSCSCCCSCSTTSASSNESE